ncbi:fimbria/pilus outer membrane usher protein [Edaphovirga cremea]|uniref:fimbria/pilus outer membrane usher protein n=1 Tax=Edaphovirga cremea TaxID=2267246 RepID=UPI000DEF7C03|nr:fimbria/pilus outer membrane usher protein [Edaphovirga cremea]
MIDPNKLYDHRRVFIPSLLSISLFAAYPALAVDEPFNPQFLEDIGGGSSVADLAVFAADSKAQPPGTYRVSIYVNGQSISTEDVRFVQSKDPQSESLQACLTLEQLKSFGVQIGAFPQLTSTQYKPEDCIPFTNIITQSSADFDFSRQLLNLSFPQAAMVTQARGYVDPSRWEEGIPAMLLDYNFSGNQQFARKNDDSRGRNSSSNFLNLRSGANLGAWRLRNYSTWQKTSYGGDSWQTISSYVQRNIIALKSQLTMGDSFTPGELFDGVQFRGIQLSSDDTMYPDSQRGFAPIIRGIAQTNAQVTIRQNGYVIYQTYVAPGPFVISDLFPTSSSGDLDVTVTEADGRTQRYIQPFSALPIMQREGRVKYSLVAGEYQGGGLSIKPKFAQGTLMWGGPRNFTVYGGILAAEHYTSLLAGVGKNLEHLGAISVDAAFATTDQPGKAASDGQSYRFLYGKTFAESGTDIRLLGYRYSTSGFYTFDEATRIQDEDNQDNLNYHKRSQIQGTITQRIGDSGSLFLTASRQEYWGNVGRQDLYQGGYSGSWDGISYSASYSYSTSPDQERADKIVAFNVSIPLDRFLNRAWATYYLTTNRGRTAQQAGISGTLLEDNNLNYNVQQSYANQGVGASGNASLAYRGTYGSSSLGYNYNSNNQQVNYGLSGGVVAHENGVTLSQSLSDTIALVEAPGAGNANVLNNTGVTTDWRGYAVIPSVTPYRLTRISVDSTTLGDNVELLESGADIVPTRGAVVRASLSTRVGYRVLMTMLQANGKPVPFGAIVSLANDKSKDPLTAIVGDQGQTYLTGLPVAGKLNLQWGNDAEQVCVINFKLPVSDKTTPSLIQMPPTRCQ